MGGCCCCCNKKKKEIKTPFLKEENKVEESMIYAKDINPTTIREIVKKKNGEGVNSGIERPPSTGETFDSKKHKENNIEEEKRKISAKVEIKDSSNSSYSKNTSLNEKPKNQDTKKNSINDKRDNSIPMVKLTPTEKSNSFNNNTLESNKTSNAIPYPLVPEKEKSQANINENSEMIKTEKPSKPEERKSSVSKPVIPNNLYLPINNTNHHPITPGSTSQEINNNINISQVESQEKKNIFTSDTGSLENESPLQESKPKNIIDVPPVVNIVNHNENDKNTTIESKPDNNIDNKINPPIEVDVKKENNNNENNKNNNENKKVNNTLEESKQENNNEISKKETLNIITDEPKPVVEKEISHKDSVTIKVNDFTSEVKKEDIKTDHVTIPIEDKRPEVKKDDSQISKENVIIEEKKEEIKKEDVPHKYEFIIKVDNKLKQDTKKDISHNEPVIPKNDIPKSEEKKVEITQNEPAKKQLEENLTKDVKKDVSKTENSSTNSKNTKRGSRPSIKIIKEEDLKLEDIKEEKKQNNLIEREEKKLDNEQIEIILIINNLIEEYEKEELEIELFTENENKKGEYVSHGKTEKQSGVVLFYEKNFVYYYIFNKTQNLKFEISLSNGKKYTVFTTVGRIIGSKNHNVVIQIGKEEKEVDYSWKEPPTPLESNVLKLEVVLKRLEKNEVEIGSCLKIDFKLKLQVMPEKSIIFKLKAIDLSNGNEDVVYISEFQKNKKEFSFNELCSNKEEFISKYPKQGYRIEFYEKNNKELFGKTDNLTINEIMKKNNEVKVSSSQGVLGKVALNYSEKEKSSFLSYFETGLQISLIVGIDYTSSNLPITDVNSLHHISQNKLNPYQEAITSCGAILSFYDYDQKFPVYGFGGIPEGQREVSHCFNVNFDKNNAEVDGIEGILKAYKESLPRVKLLGPTCFNYIIKATLERLKKITADVKNYFVLMLITDGRINDMNQTIDVVVEASRYPLSIIIIGVGDGDFGDMEKLDGDEIPIVNSKGETRLRDIVQFVTFNQFNGNSDKLSEVVLSEIPSQVEEYYRIKGISPGFSK